ncbi:hypothetical protein MCOR02_009682 [Pyricularia oryzae]|nr:hypothetical protein MCOR02_009682 [Pyricularia oryzae]
MTLAVPCQVRRVEGEQAAAGRSVSFTPLHLHKHASHVHFRRANGAVDVQKQLRKSNQVIFGGTMNGLP